MNVMNRLIVGRIANVDCQFQASGEPEEIDDQKPYGRVGRFLPDESVGFAFVDRACRDYVTPFLLAKIRLGGLLIIDNMNRYLPSPTVYLNSLSPTTAPSTLAWQQAAAALSGCRRTWTTSGVWDKVIFLKPRADPSRSDRVDLTCITMATTYQKIPRGMKATQPGKPRRCCPSLMTGISGPSRLWTSDAAPGEFLR